MTSLALAMLLICENLGVHCGCGMVGLTVHDRSAFVTLDGRFCVNETSSEF